MGGDIDVGVVGGGRGQQPVEPTQKLQNSLLFVGGIHSGRCALAQKKKEQKCQLKRNHISIN